MTFAELVSVGSNIATPIGVAVAAWQLWLVRNQEVTSFEDSLASEYRALAATLPTKALLGEPLTTEEQDAALDEFYRYFDLSNHQVFLHERGRISERTWQFWREGIASNIQRPAFASAWSDVASRANGDFAELRSLFPPGPVKRCLEPGDNT